MNIPRIYEPIELGGYHPDLEGECVWVWVNPSRSIIQEFGARALASLRPERPLSRLRKFVAREDNNREIVAWFAKVWSLDAAHETDEKEVVDFASQVVEQDPAIWDFLVNETWVLINLHRAMAKKGLGPLSGTSQEAKEPATTSISGSLLSSA